MKKRYALIGLAIAGTLGATALAPAQAATDPNKVTLYKTFTFRAGEQLTGGGTTIGVPVRFSWTQLRPQYICKQTYTVSGNDLFDQQVRTTAPYPEGYSYSLGTSLTAPTVYSFTIQNKIQTTCNNYPGTPASDSKQYQLNPPQQETSSAVTFTGTGWNSESSSNYSGGSTKFSKVAGDRVTFTYGGNAVGFITSTGPDRGKANVYVDGAKRATIDLYSATESKYRYIGYSFYQDTTAVHRLVIEVVGGKRVDADAFLYAAPVAVPAKR